MSRLGTALVGCLVLLGGCGVGGVAQSALTASVTANPESHSPESPSPTRESTTTVFGTKTTSSSRSTSSAKASGSRTVSCQGHSGDTTYSHPLELGVITAKVVLSGCDPLTPGSPFHALYVSFTLTGKPGSSAYAGARFTLTSAKPSAVHPRVVDPAGRIVKNNGAGYWTGTGPNYTGRYQRIGDLPSGRYVLGLEKVDAPQRPSTPSFDVVVDPD